MKNVVLKTRKEVVSAIIREFPGGRKNAASHIGLSLKKFDNHAYENNNIRPLTDTQICHLERESRTTYMPNYVAAMYGGIFVKVAEPENLDRFELYALSVRTDASRGRVDQIIAQALDDGVIDLSEADAIASAHSAHMAARHSEILAAIELHRPRTEGLQ